MRSLALSTLILLMALASPARAHDWNDASITWLDYEKGLSEARASKKPVCLVFYTDWCPRCAEFSVVFHDPQVVEMSDKFVMVRVERDSHAKISDQYNLDGTYIPRTYFLTSQGVVAPKIHAERDKYKYFYNPKDPKDLLKGMKTALDKLN